MNYRFTMLSNYKHRKPEENEKINPSIYLRKTNNNIKSNATI